MYPFDGLAKGLKSASFVILAKARIQQIRHALDAGSEPALDLIQSLPWT
jgi:hypothetical protein